MAVQLGKMVEDPNQSQPNPGLRAHESPCIFLEACLKVNLECHQMWLQLSFLLLQEQPLRPSILKELSEGHGLLPQPAGGAAMYVSDEDEVLLEDETQRIRLRDRSLWKGQLIRD